MNLIHNFYFIMSTPLGLKPIQSTQDFSLDLFSSFEEELSCKKTDPATLSRLFSETPFLECPPHRRSPLSKKTINLLSFDGGGLRGYLSSLLFYHIFKQVREALPDDIQDISDLFTDVIGTSIGGFLAAGYVIKNEEDDFAYEIHQAIHLFESHWPSAIFRPRTSSEAVHTIFHAMYNKYSPQCLDECINTVLGEAKFKDCKLGLTLTAFNNVTKKPQLFSSDDPKLADVRIVDAALCTTAAPSYFPERSFNPFSTEEQYFVDGGLPYPNPTAIGYCKAKQKATKEGRSIGLVCSIGTGYTPPNPSLTSSSSYGFMSLLPRAPDIYNTAYVVGTDSIVRDKSEDPESPFCYVRFDPSISFETSNLDNRSQANLQALRTQAFQYIQSEEFKENINKIIEFIKRQKKDVYNNTFSLISTKRLTSSPLKSKWNTQLATHRPTSPSKIRHLTATPITIKSQPPGLKLLSIDSSGGIRLYLTALLIDHIVKRILKTFPDHYKDISSIFTSISCGSVGALLACLYAQDGTNAESETLPFKSPTEKVVELFESDIPSKIFQQSWIPGALGKWLEFARHSLFSKYDDAVLKYHIDNLIGPQMLSSSKMDLLVTAFNVTENKPHVFDSNNPAHSTLFMRDIVKATTAAPTYFPPHKINDCYFIDGSFAFPNPTLKGYIWGKQLYANADQPRSLVCSIGTGYWEPKRSIPSGFLSILPTISSDYTIGQINGTHDMMETLEESEQNLCYVRFDIPIPQRCQTIDDPSPQNLQDLKDSFESYIKSEAFEQQATKLISFFTSCSDFGENEF